MASKVGSFALPTATGNLGVTGVGFQPVAILFFCTWASTSNQLAQGLGMCDENGNEFSCCWTNDNGASNANTARIGSASHCVTLRDDTDSAIDKQAALVSMDSDGFTLNFTTADATAGLTCRYIAFGGSGVEGFVGTFSEGAATGTQAVTGIGFQPEALFVANFGQTAAPSSTAQVTSFVGFGMASAPAAQFAWTQGSADGAANSAVVSWQEESSAISVGAAFPSDTFQVDLDSFDSDGFTVDCVTTFTPGDVWHGFLALRGGQFKVGSVNKPTTPSGVAETGVGFEPEALLFTGTGHPNHAFTDARSMHPSFGASDGTTEWAQSGQDQDAAGTMVTRNYESATKAIGSMADTGVSVAAEADVSSLDSDGFTLDWTTADATVRTYGYMAFAASPAEPAPWIPDVMIF